ncbi:MAG: pyridoxal phosphate-dependent aminotransferase [Planctomycetota bacterium]|jgi:aspartate/methionine/tyrosine aminotransferase|nr:pyridoxal phosphate-dependent aminotransferase [Planctomycetota bacterium]
MPTSDNDLRFPYMKWAKTESFLSPYCLAQSGMPAPDQAFLGDPWLPELGHVGPEDLEARLGELFAVDPARVLMFPGASSAMLVAALRWFRPGSRVCSETPSYEPFRALPAYLGATTVDLERRAENRWQPDPAQAAQALAEARQLERRGSGPGHVFLSNLSNPTGVLTPPETIALLAAVAAEADDGVGSDDNNCTGGGLLISNEIYMEYVPPARRVHAHALAPNAVSIGSLTKAYGLGALRVGWMILGEGLAAERRHLEDMANLAYVNAAPVTIEAGLRALDALPTLTQPLRRVEVEARPHWERWLRESPLVETVLPEFGIIAFPRICGVDDTRALVRFLQAEFGVDVTPGEFFGAPGHLRIGCGVPEATLVEGLPRLGAGIEAYLSR